MDKIAFNELANRYFSLLLSMNKQTKPGMDLYFEGHAHGILTALYIASDHLTTSDYDFWIEGIIN